MDDTKFENRYEITKQFIRSEYKLTQKRSGKLNLWFGYCMIILFVTILFIYSIISLPNIILHLFYIIFGCLLLIYPYFIDPARKLKAFTKISGEKKLIYPPIRTVRFGEFILLQTGNYNLSYSYDKVRYIEENDECIYFWISLVMVVPLYKDSFTIGNPDEFIAFFYEKCSEQEPLWSKSELNKRLLKNMLPYMILTVAIFIYLLFRLLGR